MPHLYFETSAVLIFHRYYKNKLHLYLKRLIHPCLQSHFLDFYKHLYKIFIIGWQFYKGAYKNLKNGSANMDVLVALGTSAAYFYSGVANVNWNQGFINMEGKGKWNK
jgi:cation transport ATPase